jgi:predicted small secreted protein
MLGAMKYFVALAVLLALNCCNTCIGIGRDTEQAYLWTKGKIQGSGSNNAGKDSGAPVY